MTSKRDMALTLLKTTEQQLLPWQQAVEQGAGDGGEAVMPKEPKETDHGGDDDDRPEKPLPTTPRQAQAQAPYVHPLVRRSSRMLTQKSLEICTESLGSETGSDGFPDANSSAVDRSCPASDDERGEELAPCATRLRAFPPPLPSHARRKVESTMEMRRERHDGRLLVKFVPVTSSTLFHAQRGGGRLLLSFVDTAAPAPASDELDRSRAQPEPRPAGRRGG